MHRKNLHKYIPPNSQTGRTESKNPSNQSNNQSLQYDCVPLWISSCVPPRSAIRFPALLDTRLIDWLIEQIDHREKWKLISSWRRIFPFLFQLKSAKVVQHIKMNTLFQPWTASADCRCINQKPFLLYSTHNLTTCATKILYVKEKMKFQLQKLQSTEGDQSQKDFVTLFFFITLLLLLFPFDGNILLHRLGFLVTDRQLLVGFPGFQFGLSVRGFQCDEAIFKFTRKLFRVDTLRQGQKLRVFLQIQRQKCHNQSINQPIHGSVGHSVNESIKRQVHQPSS